MLDVRGNNYGAMGLYEAMGFEVTGRRPSFIADGDDRYDLCSTCAASAPPA